MKKLTVFNFVTLNGYFKGPRGDLSWHKHGTEENQYAAESMQSGNTLLFGRVTYEMMVSYWPTPDAIKSDPLVAAAMNSADKIVFSKTLRRVKWNNARLMKGDIVEKIREMKLTAGNDMTILGSGSIVNLFADEGLIDEYQIMLDPVVLAKGTPMFKGISHTLNLKLDATRAFASGVVLLSYSPQG